MRCFVDRPPALDSTSPTNLVTYASDAPLRFAPPRFAQGEELVEGSTDHLFAHFEAWEPAELQGATHAREGRKLTNADVRRDARPSEATEAEPEGTRTLYAEESAALRTAMAELQSHVMPDEGWALVRAGLQSHRERQQLDPRALPPPDHHVTPLLDREL